VNSLFGNFTTLSNTVQLWNLQLTSAYGVAFAFESCRSKEPHRESSPAVTLKLYKVTLTSLQDAFRQEWTEARIECRSATPPARHL